MYCDVSLAPRYGEHVCAILDRDEVSKDPLAVGKRQLRVLVDGGLIVKEDLPKAITAFQQWMAEIPDGETFDSFMQRFFTVYEEAEYLVVPELT